MKTIHWVLQCNLIREQTLASVKRALDADGISYEEVKVVPFSDELPPIKGGGDVNVIYGSTTLVLNAYKSNRYATGIFYNGFNFSVSNYIDKWKTKMLNADSEILTFGQIVEHYRNKTGEWFVRPVGDDKSFSGKVMSYEEILNFEKELKDSNNPYLTVDTLVTIGSVKQIEKEWRHFIVSKKVVSSCRYMSDGTLNVSETDVPPELVDFVNACCRAYTPHDIFVMDTALYKGGYYIVECNCFNDSGFYRHDINAIIHGVNKYLAGGVMCVHEK